MREQQSLMMMDQGPLSGYRVVEFGSNLTAPIATMLMGDQGADVIKVETPSGDQLRGSGDRRAGVTGTGTMCDCASATDYPQQRENSEQRNRRRQSADIQAMVDRAVSWRSPTPVQQFWNAARPTFPWSVQSGTQP